MAVLKWLVVWLLVFAAIALIGRQPWMNYYRLSQRGATVTGIARASKPDLKVEYSFELNGRSYVGLGRRQINGSEISPGSQVLVHYLPDNPNVSCLGDPKKLFKTESLVFLASDLVFSAIIVGLLAFQARRRVSAPSSGID